MLDAVPDFKPVVETVIDTDAGAELKDTSKILSAKLALVQEIETYPYIR
jgi:hypothetical protein